ncbi:unnamed protein product, partial [Mesorhabditis belari]|uniref:Phospholipid scramblase n=1 Tax=Mesorhabditis belari TaxID=2138241 RepID=A0AAF3FJS2_9BILA
MSQQYPHVYTIQPTGRDSYSSFSTDSADVSVPSGAAINWMPAPLRVPNCPPGLEYLTRVKGLIVEQQIDLLEVFTNWEVTNSYKIYNETGQQVYYAYEESDCCQSCFCGASRGYTIHIVDNFRREVMTIIRPFKCCGGVFCANESYVEAPPGQWLGEIKQTFGFLQHNFVIGDEHGRLNIKGPQEIGCGFACDCGEKIFKVKTKEGTTIGEIRKKCGGVMREYFTDADTFSVYFPENLTVGLKANMLAATFLIDFLSFENRNPSQQQNFHF